MIARKIDEADGVIFVSPAYSMHVSYLFKRFVDRFACTFHRPCYWGKYGPNRGGRRKHWLEGNDQVSEGRSPRLGL